MMTDVPGRSPRPARRPDARPEEARRRGQRCAAGRGAEHPRREIFSPAASPRTIWAFPSTTSPPCRRSRASVGVTSSTRSASIGRARRRHRDPHRRRGGDAEGDPVQQLRRLFQPGLSARTTYLLGPPARRQPADRHRARPRSRDPPPEDRAAAIKRRAFHAILDEEERRLTKSRAVRGIAGGDRMTDEATRLRSRSCFSVRAGRP